MQPAGVNCKGAEVAGSTAGPAALLCNKLGQVVHTRQCHQASHWPCVRLQCIIHLRAQGLREMSTPPTLLMGYSTLPLLEVKFSKKWTGNILSDSLGGSKDSTRPAAKPYILDYSIEYRLG